MSRPVRLVVESLPASFRRAGWQPPADIHRLRDGWLVKFDLAGIRPEDVRLTVQGSVLTVGGVRRDWKIEGCLSCYSMEISYSDFERSIEFPANLEQAHVTTEYREGMLLVRLLTEEA
jgi:HSP20 family protein